MIKVSGIGFGKRLFIEEFPPNINVTKSEPFLPTGSEFIILNLARALRCNSVAPPFPGRALVG